VTHEPFRAEPTGAIHDRGLFSSPPRRTGDRSTEGSENFAAPVFRSLSLTQSAFALAVQRSFAIKAGRFSFWWFLGGTG